MSSDDKLDSPDIMHPSDCHLQTASDVFIERIADQVNKEDCSKMVEAQVHMLSRFEKTNEMLLNFNVLAKSRYDTTCREFKRHTQLLYDMKQDLDSCFARIRNIKTKLGKQYPTAFSACGDVYSMIEENEEDLEIEGSLAPAPQLRPAVHTQAAVGLSLGNPASDSTEEGSNATAVTQPKSHPKKGTKVKSSKTKCVDKDGSATSTASYPDTDTALQAADSVDKSMRDQCESKETK